MCSPGTGNIVDLALPALAHQPPGMFSVTASQLLRLKGIRRKSEAFQKTRAQGVQGAKGDTAVKGAREEC